MVAVTLAVAVTSAPRVASADPVTVRDVVTYSAFGLAAVAVAVGIGESVHAYSLDSQNEKDQAQVPVTVVNVCNSSIPAAADACRTQNDASNAWTIASVAYVAGLAFATTGLVLLLTKPHAAAKAGSVDVTPAVSPRTAGLQLRIAF